MGEGSPGKATTNYFHSAGVSSGSDGVSESKKRKRDVSDVTGTTTDSHISEQAHSQLLADPVPTVADSPCDALKSL